MGYEWIEPMPKGKPETFARSAYTRNVRENLADLSNLSKSEQTQIGKLTSERIKKAVHSQLGTLLGDL